MPQTPYYIVYEDLGILKDVSERADVKIIMALKANALWKTFKVIAENFPDSTASSLNEMRLSLDYLGGEVHTYCPVYTDQTFPEFLAGSSHITFNSVNLFQKFLPQTEEWNRSNPDRRVSPGLRVNPHCSVIETDIYNPCVPGSRFGVNPDRLSSLPHGIEGLHFHALCESTSFDLEKVLEAFKAQFGHLLPEVKWLNMGGGHLMTRKGYDTDHLVSLLNGLHREYPHLKLIMEPGSAFTWQTGDLVTEVLDIVEDSGIRTAIIDASFACHMPDVLEMPYQPEIAEAFPNDSRLDNEGFDYRLGGNSCLSGDFAGPWRLPKELKPGDMLTLKDMNHYTTVKTNMFNGIQHPDIYWKPIYGDAKLLRHYTYEDYRDRMD